MPKISLSPPPYTLYSKIQKVLGADPHVHVLPMQSEGSTYEVRLVVADEAKAIALAKSLQPEHEMGTETVRVTVIDINGLAYNNDPDDDPSDIVETVDDALRSNMMFHSAVVSDRVPPVGVGQVVAIFQPMIVQFFNDDLTDYFYNANLVAASVFGDLLRKEYPNDITLSVTTDPTGG